MEIIMEMVVAGLYNVREAGRSPSDASLRNLQCVPEKYLPEISGFGPLGPLWTVFGPLLVQNLPPPSKIVLTIRNGP